MLEKENIQSRGFRNITEGGKITGFQVPIRAQYYRGVWLTMLRPATVTVDGEVFEGDKVSWTIGGKTYAQTELSNYPDVSWQKYEPAILNVIKPGGLKLGIHEVKVTYGYITSYMRVSTNWLSNAEFSRKMTIAR